MSLTETHDVVAIAHEDGLNDLIHAFFTARPRHLLYGTNAFVGSTTATSTNLSPIAFPGIPGGIQYAVLLTPPTIDLHPDTAGTPLPPGPDQFTASTKVFLAVLCGRRRRDPKSIQGGSPSEVKVTTLELHARGAVAAVGGELRFGVEAVEIVDIDPDHLESFLECILLMIIQAVLATIRIPLGTLGGDAFSLTLTDGPRIEDDTLKVFGTI